MTHEVLEQRELARSKLDRHTGTLDVPGQPIETQIGEGQLGRLLRNLPASRERLHTGEQFWKRERLGQIIVATRLQALDPVVYRVARTEEQDRSFTPARRRALTRLRPSRRGSMMSMMAAA